MKELIIFLAICMISLSCESQSKTFWNNFDWDSVYVSGDDDEYLNIVVNEVGTWQIIRPFGQAPEVYVADYYISPTGNDATGDGSYETPWFTLDKVWTVVAAGDTVYCRGGTYNWLDQQLLTGVNGTSSDTIKIFAYPGETPIFTASGSYTPPGAVNSAKPLILMTADYTWWKGITIADYEQASAQTDGYNAMYIRSGSDHNLFEQLVAYNCGSGFYLRGTSDQNIFLNCDSYNHEDPYSSTPYGNADGFAAAWNTDVSDTNWFIGCRAWGNSDDGFDYYNNDGFVYTHESWTMHNGFRQGSWTTGGDGNGFKLGDQAAGGATDTSRYLRNCIAFGDRERGFAENDMDERVELYNNLAYRVGHIGSVTTGAGFGFWGSAIAHPMKNNIAYDNHTDYQIGDNTNVSFNDWNLGGVTISDADWVSIDTLLFDDPRLSDGSLPYATTLFFPANGSDIIDAGTDVGLPYQGVAPDIGIKERE